MHRVRIVHTDDIAQCCGCCPRGDECREVPDRRRGIPEAREPAVGGWLGGDNMNASTGTRQRRDRVEHHLVGAADIQPRDDNDDRHRAEVAAAMIGAQGAHLI